MEHTLTLLVTQVQEVVEAVEALVVVDFHRGTEQEQRVKALGGAAIMLWQTTTLEVVVELAHKHKTEALKVGGAVGLE
jgi:hypothetical protein